MGLACALSPGLAARMVLPVPGSVVLAAPEAGARRIGVIRSSRPLESRGQHTFFDNRHPLSRYYRFDLVELDDGTEGWLCPELRAVETASGVGGVSAVRRSAVGLQVLWVLDLLLAAAAALALLPRWLRGLSRRTGIALPTLVAGLQGVLVVSLGWGRLLGILLGAHQVVATPCDELGYFEVARDLLNGSLQGPWRFTLGLPLLYVPFVWFFQATSAFDLIIPFSGFNGFVVMPACALLILAILRRLTGSAGKALAATCLWLLLPLIYHRFEYWDDRLFKSFVDLPTVTFCFQLYTELIAMGFNAMSDVPALFLMLLALWLAVRSRPDQRSRAVVGATLGAACLVRLNCVYMAPALAWFLWRADRARLAQWRHAVPAVAIALGAFAAVFAPQWMVNRLQFGSAWTFPYVLHSTDAASGFEWRCVPVHLQYLMHSNYLYVVPGGLALLWQPDRELRTGLALWAVPMIAFFAGYTNSFCDATRFILIAFPALVAAVVCLESRREAPREGAWVLPALLGVTLLCTSPSGYGFSRVSILSLGSTGEGALLAVALAAAAGALLRLRRQRQPLLLAAVFLLVWYSGQVWAAAACLVAALARAAWDWGEDVTRHWRRAGRTG
jgi:hypothetical protein